ncbi:MAG TPA: tagaturonate epimerase family protein [Anaerolineae bacterium]|nr:tagaturonate epimerase family protein [Anaerolineae bacterium]
MDDLYALLGTQELSPPLPDDLGLLIAERLKGIAARDVYWRSITAAHQAVCFLCKGEAKVLGILYGGENPTLDEFEGIEAPVVVGGTPLNLRLCPTTYANAVALHRAISFTAPRLLGLVTSAGCGDRLGLATPGHVRAILKTDIAPVFAQQSIREMERTGRTPEDVVNDATWGVFQEGWRDGYGADADHLKSAGDIDVCVAAGFTFYTFDPREQVDNDAHTDTLSTLRKKFASLPWSRLEDSPQEMRGRYLKSFSIEDDYALAFDEMSLLRAACKYGKALAHVTGLYRYLRQAMQDRPFEVEVSVDETDTTTSPEEHFFIASELRRLGVSWVSLAPRYVGRFEKGVDYIGDLEEFDAAVAKHAAIARCCGPYKLSIHSGSDKFSIYPFIARRTRGLVHLKTAGTSYLEALRAIAEVDPQLFREILVFSFERYDEDKATYHVSAEPHQALRPDDLADGELTRVLDNFHNRQMLHVTFGSVLTEHVPGEGYRFRDRFFDVLRANEETYYRVLEAHFDRHLEPFQ